MGSRAFNSNADTAIAESAHSNSTGDEEFAVKRRRIEEELSSTTAPPDVLTPPYTAPSSGTPTTTDAAPSDAATPPTRSSSSSLAATTTTTTKPVDQKLRILNPENIDRAALLYAENVQLARQGSSDKFALPYSPRQVLSPRAASKNGEPVSPQHLNVPLPLPTQIMAPPPMAKDQLCKRTVLHEAILSCDMDAFDEALKSGLSREEIDACESESGYSALMSAAACDNADLGLMFCCKLLAKGANALTVDHEGFSALHWAAAMGHVKIMSCLIDAGAHVNGKSDIGDTPLHRASRFGQEDAIGTLIMLHGANIHARNKHELTALDCAGRFCGNKVLKSRLVDVVRKAFFSADPKLKTLILYHEECLGHRTSHAHQEAPERISTIFALVKKEIQPDYIHTSGNFLAASQAQLEYAHDKRYINFVFDLHDKVASLGKPVPFTPRVQVMNGVEEHKVKDETGCDTFFSEGSLPAALRAVGAVCNAVDRVISGHNRSAFCIVRPPGHHAGVSGLLDNAISCGFCIFNNVAIGAMHALKKYPEYVNRIAIVDFDVHHGNGTEEIVKDKIKQPDKVFFFSIHLYDKPEDKLGLGEFYPGSGKTDIPDYNIVNTPMVPLWRVPTCRTRSRTRNRVNEEKVTPKRNNSIGSVSSASSKASSTSSTSSGTSSPATPASEKKPVYGRKAFREHVQKKLVPALRNFDPDLVFISAGFDAGKNDIGCSRTENGKYCSGIDLSAADYQWATKEIQSVAQVCCEGRVISVLEGGYGQWARAPGSGEGKSSSKKLVLNRQQLAENALSHVKGMVGF